MGATDKQHFGADSSGALAVPDTEDWSNFSRWPGGAGAGGPWAAATLGQLACVLPGVP